MGAKYPPVYLLTLYFIRLRYPIRSIIRVRLISGGKYCKLTERKRLISLFADLESVISFNEKLPPEIEKLSVNRNIASFRETDK